MNVLLLGGTGATGRLLLRMLLEGDHSVVVLVRSADRIDSDLRGHPNLVVHEETALSINADKLQQIVSECDVAVSCLGHNMTLKGIFGKPRRLVRDSIHRVHQATAASERAKPLKFVLMSSAGCVNPAENERVSVLEGLIINLMRILLPPHADNEAAARYLSDTIGVGNSNVEWVVVRPDTLLNQETVSRVEFHPSPIRSAVFNAGETSRINVANSMVRFISDQDLWKTWRGRMPVVYNSRVGKSD